MNAGRVQKLEELGFQWGTMKKDRWEARFRELKKFKEEHGHCDVPSKHPGGLGDWVYAQRRGHKESRLEADRIQKLEELGFQWRVMKKPARGWEARLQDLKEFKEEHGHCNVPQRHPGGLGKWVADQRYLRKTQGKGMNAGRVQKLEELGFQWGTMKKDRWEARFRELKKFKEEHGHCDVPSKHPGGLGDWVYAQRCGHKESRLEASRIQKLEELGFQWRLGKFGHCNVSRRKPGGPGTPVHVPDGTLRLEDVRFHEQDDFEDSSLSEAAAGIKVEAVTGDNADSKKLSYPIQQRGNGHPLNACAELAGSPRGIEAVEQTRQQMQAAAARGDCILSGKLQKLLAQLVALQKRMQQAAQQGDFIRARNLQAQLNALYESAAKKTATAMMVCSPKSTHLEFGGLWI